MRHRHPRTPLTTVRGQIADWLAVAGQDKLTGKSMYQESGSGMTDTDLFLVKLIRLSHAIFEILDVHECITFAFEGPDEPCDICGRVVAVHEFPSERTARSGIPGIRLDDEEGTA